VILLKLVSVTCRSLRDIVAQTGAMFSNPFTSVVPIMAETGRRGDGTLLGAGIVITPTIVLTCRHVIEELDDCDFVESPLLGEAVLCDSHLHHPTSARASNVLDLCVLHFASLPGTAPAPLARQARLTNRKLTAVGFSQQERVTQRIVPDLRVLQDELCDGLLQAAQLGSGLPGGFSGSPVLEELEGSWYVVGLLSSGGETAPTSRIIAVDPIASFLAQNGIECSIVDLRSLPPASADAANKETQAGRVARQSRRSRIAASIGIGVVAVLLLIAMAFHEFSVAPPPVAELQASSTSLQVGESTTLTWSTSNATDVRLEPIGNVPLHGSLQVTPTESATYRLVSRNANGDVVEKTAFVKVMRPTVSADEPQKATARVETAPPKQTPETSRLAIANARSVENAEHISLSPDKPNDSASSAKTGGSPVSSNETAEPTVRLKMSEFSGTVFPSFSRVAIPESAQKRLEIWLENASADVQFSTVRITLNGTPMTPLVSTTALPHGSRTHVRFDATSSEYTLKPGENSLSFSATDVSGNKYSARFYLTIQSQIAAPQLIP
jgi:hypothetical protein